MTNNRTINWILTVVLILNCFTSLSESYYDRKTFKKIVLKDKTNDNAINLNTVQLIRRSGFLYKQYYVVAEDGYVTHLIRLINPLADKTQLRGPPIMMFHGANVDTSIYVAASSIEHHPEYWPKVDENLDEKPSSQRSYGFALSNAGYDVWLIGSRGSNMENRAYVPPEQRDAALEQGLNFRPTLEMLEFSKKEEYWTYGLDDIIRYDIGKQIETVKQITKADQVSILSFSLSTPTTMAFLGENWKVAKDVRAYIQLAPAISADHRTFFSKAYFEKICPRLSNLGIGFTPTFWIKPAAKKAVMTLAKSPAIRYRTVRGLLNTLFGYSQKYHTNLELNILNRIFQTVSFRSIQHYCQNSVSKKFTRFDYGKKINMLMYSSVEPQEYIMDQIDVQNWLVVAGSYDVLADQTTMTRLLETTQSAKKTFKNVPGFSHLDVVAAVQVDEYIVRPLIEYLNERHPSGEYDLEPSFADDQQNDEEEHEIPDDGHIYVDEDDGYDVHIN